MNTVNQPKETDMTKNAKNAPKKTAAKTSNKKSLKAQVVEKVAKAKGEGIGAFTKVLILQGLAVKEIETSIKAKFPNCGPQINSIYYYRSQLHKSGELLKA